ncbi:hypothetical protein OSB04_013434 [Centaurea solstitialis]|uniref:FBD domain-containing protein n=1 Tax=Centaurea solstitialis TaxID=347529 RepID=A0AA38TPY5_9ASTR|nr:hypothetical protein OSB04_013434 [Centaurea solstitialis]
MAPVVLNWKAYPTKRPFTLRLPENHERKDKVSILPQDLIGLILERLLVQDAVRTSILSKEWRELFVETCTNVYNFNIKANNLDTLVVDSCPDAMLLRLLDAPCLNMVGVCFTKPLKDFVPVERINLTMLLSNLPEVEVLIVDGYFLKYLSVDELPKWLPCAVDTLIHLYLIDVQFSDLDQLHGALCLLRNSPNLETLWMVHPPIVSQGCHKYFLFSYVVQELDAKSSMHFMPFQEPQVMDYDAGPASNHLESPDCMDQTLNELHTVEIESFEGSRPELLFIKLLLAHSPSLEELTIKPSGTSDAHQRLNKIAMDVSRFPRASPKAELIFLNPKP